MLLAPVDDAPCCCCPPLTMPPVNPNVLTPPPPGNLPGKFHPAASDYAVPFRLSGIMSGVNLQHKPDGFGGRIPGQIPQRNIRRRIRNVRRNPSHRAIRLYPNHIQRKPHIRHPESLRPIIIIDKQHRRIRLQRQPPRQPLRPFPPSQSQLNPISRPPDADYWPTACLRRRRRWSHRQRWHQRRRSRN